jgi:hypothetical protein
VTRYGVTSGAALNVQKSRALVVNPPLGQAQAVCGIPIVQEGALVRSLGVAYGADMQLEVSWEGVIKRMKQQLGQGLRRCCSLMGRVVLCNALIASLASYLATFILPSTSQLNQMDNIIWHMVWGKPLSQNNIQSRVRRGVVIRCWRNGGLGVISVSDMVRGLQTKMACRLLNQWGAYWAVFARYWCNLWGERWADDEATLLSRLPRAARDQSSWAAAIAIWQRLKWRPTGVPSHGATLGASLWLAPLQAATRAVRLAHSAAMTAMADAGIRHLGDLVDEGGRTWYNLEELMVRFPGLEDSASRHVLQNGLHALITSLLADHHAGAAYVDRALGPPSPPPVGAWWTERMSNSVTLTGRVKSTAPCDHPETHGGQGGFDIILTRYVQAPSGIWIAATSTGTDYWGDEVQVGDEYSLCGYAHEGTELGGVAAPGQPIRKCSLPPLHWQGGEPAHPITTSSLTRDFRRAHHALNRDTAAPLLLWSKRYQLVRPDVLTARIQDHGFSWLRRGPYVAKAQEVVWLFWHSSLYPRTEENRERRGVSCTRCIAKQIPTGYEAHLITCHQLAGHWGRLARAFSRWWPQLRVPEAYRVTQHRPAGEVQCSGFDPGLPLLAACHYFWLWVITLHTAWSAKAAEFYGTAISQQRLQFQQEEGWRTAAMVRWERLKGRDGAARAKGLAEMQGWVRLDIGLEWGGSDLYPRLVLASGGLRADGLGGLDDGMRG